MESAARAQVGRIVEGVAFFSRLDKIRFQRSRAGFRGRALPATSVTRRSGHDTTDGKFLILSDQLFFGSVALINCVERQFQAIRSSQLVKDPEQIISHGMLA